jgi:UDP-glucose 4-epimerase
MQIFPHYYGKKVLVTGGAGFIGSHLVEALIKNGAKVTVLDNLKTGKMSNLKTVSHKVRTIVGDISDQEECNNAVKKVSHIFHLAAISNIELANQDPGLCEKINVMGTANILEATKTLKNKPKIIFSSSSAVYGQTENNCDENSELKPISNYAKSKKDAELLLQNFVEENELTGIALRYFNVIGERASADKKHSPFFAKALKSLKNKAEILIFGDGTQKRDFVEVEKVVQANLVVGNSQLQGFHAFNIATGKSISILEMIEKLAKKININDFKLKFAPPRTGDVKNSLANCEKYENLLRDFKLS